MITIAWQLCRRHWAAFLVLALWYASPWFAAALSVDLSLALRFSWMGSVPFAIYMYQATSGSQLLGILPLARREVWQITCVVGALVPALMQLAMATVVWWLAAVTLPTFASTHLVGIDTLVLGAVYSLAFLQLVLIATAAVRRQHPVTATLALGALGIMMWLAQFLPARLSEFTTTSALAFWAAAVLGVVIVRVPGSLAAPVPDRSQSYRFAFGLPHIGILDRLTGVKRILLIQTLLGVLCFGAAFGSVLLMSMWLDGVTLGEVVADELQAFSGGGEWVLRPGNSLFYTPMWVIGLANIWTPMARQLRVLPLTPRQANTVFLSFPVGMWVVLWAMYFIAYAFIVGGPMTPRLDLFLAISGTSTLANVISLRWKNRVYGMLGVAFVYSFWLVASMATWALNLTDVLIPLTVIGTAFYGAAIAINHNTLGPRDVRVGGVSASTEVLRYAGPKLARAAPFKFTTPY